MKPRTFADVLLLLEDMREYAQKAHRFSRGRGLADLEGNEPYRFSILYPLQVIGEAAGKVPPGVRSLCGSIPWGLVTGFRHVVVHGYGEVKLDKVQSILDEELEPLIAALDTLISAVEAKGEELLP